MPPSPVVMILRGWNENATSPPLPPIGTPRYVGAERARRVLHHVDAERVAEPVDGVEVGGDAGLVHEEHGRASPG